MYDENEIVADEYVDDNTIVDVDDDYYDDFDDEQAYASAGWGTDESYGFYGSEY